MNIKVVDVRLQCTVYSYEKILSHTKADPREERVPRMSFTLEAKYLKGE